MRRNRYPLLLLLVAGFIYTIPAYNKYWAPFDEGIIAVAAQRLLAGELPYKDFFIVMYPPGQIYILAALFQFFSGSLIAGRVYTCLMSLSIASLVFIITGRLTKNVVISSAAYIFMIASLVPRLGAIPSPIWPGTLLALLTLYIFMRYLEGRRYFLAASAGLAAGVTALFRHDLAFSVSAAILISLVIEAFRIRSLKPVISFICAAAAVTVPWALYFIKMSAGKDLFNSLIGFISVHQKTAGISLPGPCFNLNMIFHQSLYFINANQFYIPFIAYIWIGGVIIWRFVRRKFYDGPSLGLLALVLYGVITYKQVLVRSDPAHLLMMIAPAVMVSSYIVSDAFRERFKVDAVSISKYSISILLAFLFFLLFIKNTDKYLKNVYTKPVKKDTIKTDFNKGAIYLPRDEREDVLNVLGFIRENTSPSERIYIGNAAHWKDDFGGSLLLYYLSDRLPSTKYYELLPGLVTDKDVQKEIARSLDSQKIRFLILQDVDLGSARREDVPKGSLVLDDFIKRNYREVKKAGKFHIYKRKGA
jgi:hypothetical protein